MFERFFPDEYVVSTYVIPFERLYEEGYRGVIFDIDNTLVPHGAPADDRAKKLFRRLKEIGFSSCLNSNNQEERVKEFQEEDRQKKCSIRRFGQIIFIMRINLQRKIMRKR